MLKLTALTEYLRNPAILKQAGIKCNPEKIDSWAESGSPEYLGDTGADGGLTLFEDTYRAVIVFEEVSGDIRLLIALILTWLEENDPDRDDLANRNIEWEGDPYDDKTSDIEIELWFQEKVYFNQAMVDSENPQVTYKGQNFELATESIDVAENDETLPPIEVG